MSSRICLGSLFAHDFPSRVGRTRAVQLATRLYRLTPVEARAGRGGSFARRLRDRKYDTGYDTPWRPSEGALAAVSQTAVYDTC